MVEEIGLDHGAELRVASEFN